MSATTGSRTNSGCGGNFKLERQLSGKLPLLEKQETFCSAMVGRFVSTHRGQEQNQMGVLFLTRQTWKCQLSRCKESS